MSPYCWPVKPFHKQHPVRGFLNDPRIGRDSRTFHFGIDVSAPDGTAVYAVEPGTAFREGKGAVSVVSGHRVFGYWHIAAAVADGAHVDRHELLGHIRAPWGHVHFAEKSGDSYRNPLRRGGIEPFVDETAPTIDAITVRRDGRTISPGAVRGVVELLVEAWDTTPLLVPPPFARMPVSPALVRWRLMRGGSPLRPWTTALDSRTTHLKADHYHAVYARGTKQNRPNRPGRYRIHLTHGLDTRTIADGDCRLQVEAADTHGNHTVASLVLTIANGS
jgi:hypothetical protein